MSSELTEGGAEAGCALLWERRGGHDVIGEEHRIVGMLLRGLGSIIHECRRNCQNFRCSRFGMAHSLGADERTDRMTKRVRDTGESDDSSKTLSETVADRVSVMSDGIECSGRVSA